MYLQLLAHFGSDEHFHPWDLVIALVITAIFCGTIMLVVKTEDAGNKK